MKACIVIRWDFPAQVQILFTANFFNRKLKVLLGTLLQYFFQVYVQFPFRGIRFARLPNFLLIYPKTRKSDRFKSVENWAEMVNTKQSCQFIQKTLTLKWRTIWECHACERFAWKTSSFPHLKHPIFVTCYFLTTSNMFRESCKSKITG